MMHISYKLKCKNKTGTLFDMKNNSPFSNKYMIQNDSSIVIDYK